MKIWDAGTGAEEGSLVGRVEVVGMGVAASDREERMEYIAAVAAAPAPALTAAMTATVVFDIVREAFCFPSMRVSGVLNCIYSGGCLV